jgi:PKD domain/Polysaccharide lyase
VSRSGLWRGGALVACITFAACLTPASGEAAFSGTVSLDAETCDLSQFAATEIERASASTAPTVTIVRRSRHPADVAQGNCAIEYYMPAHGKRAENPQTYSTAGMFTSGQSIWIARWQKLDAGAWAEQGYNTGHQLTMQIKTSNASVGGPFGFEDRGKAPGCSSACWQFIPSEYSSGVSVLSRAVVKGRWEAWLYHFVFSKDPHAGLIEIWRDGALQYSQHHQTLDAAGYAYYKQGIYRNPKISAPSRAWIDGTTISTSEAAAERGAWGAATKGPAASPASLKAVASASPADPVAGATTVRFDGSRSAGAVSYRWSLDDITYLSGAKPTFVFRHPGTKHVTLTVTGSGGTTSSASLDVVVR